MYSGLVSWRRVPHVSDGKRDMSAWVEEAMCHLFVRCFKTG
jgi:hypothetical protein